MRKSVGRHVRTALWVGLSITGLLALPLGSTSAAADDDSYEWSAELVSLDEAANTLTVKARIVSDVDADALFRNFSNGDRVLVVWSGMFDRASGIRDVVTYDAKEAAQRFRLPAEFVADGSENQYLTFKVEIPADDLKGLTGLTPGEWVTMTSKQESTTSTFTVAAARPYVVTDAGATSN